MAKKYISHTSNISKDGTIYENIAFGTEKNLINKQELESTKLAMIRNLLKIN